MPYDLQAGDFLIFQLESGYGILRLLARSELNGRPVWHLAAYENLFLEVDRAEAALANPGELTISHPHLALTNRAFESTQVARLGSLPLNRDERMVVAAWQNDPNSEPSDRSVRLMLGMR